MKSIQTRLDERGATMLEYALMAALISLVCVAGVASTGEAVYGVFWAAGDKMASGSEIGDDVPPPPLIP